MNSKVSIITVCWNVENEIMVTLESVLKQNYKNIEHIIIDGLSTDCTVETVTRFKDEKHCEYLRMISEKDSGIYNAMNKGIVLAHGDWIIFLNAGDSFYSESAISELIKNVTENCSFIYGDANYIEGDFNYLVRHKDIKEIEQTMPFCHQSIMCKTSIISKYMYNENYRVCADYDLFLRAFIAGEEFVGIDTIVCNYKVGGFSKNNQIALIKERARIKKANNLIIDDRSYYMSQITKIYLRRFLKSILPESLAKKIKKHIYK